MLLVFAVSIWMQLSFSISICEYVRRSTICAGRPRYFMDLPKTEAYLDATFGGNESRFINHACGKAANCRSQKMVVLKLPPQASNSRVSDLDDPDVSMSEEEEVHVIIEAKNNILKNILTEVVKKAATTENLITQRCVPCEKLCFCRTNDLCNDRYRYKSNLSLHINLS